MTSWERFWQACGLDPEEVQVLSELQLTWDPAAHMLRISEAHAQQEDLVSQVSRILLSVMRFRTFTLSRWATVGPSCRCLMAAWALGLSRLVAMCREDKQTSQYYLGGFTQLDQAARRFAALVGTTSHLANSLILFILEDDCLGMHHDEFQACLKDEVLYVRRLSIDVWEKLTLLFDVGCDALCLRDAVFHSADF